MALWLVVWKCKITVFHFHQRYLTSASHHLIDSSDEKKCLEATRIEPSSTCWVSVSVSYTYPFLGKGKVKTKRLGTQEKVDKGRLHRRCLDDITTPPQFSGLSGSTWGRWHHNSNFFIAKSILWVFVIPKLMRLTTEGWNLILLFLSKGHHCTWSFACVWRHRWGGERHEQHRRRRGRRWTLTGGSSRPRTHRNSPGSFWLISYLLVTT